VAEIKVLARSIGIASKAEQTRLRLESATPVLRIVRRRVVGRQISYEQIILSLGRLPGLLPASEVASELWDLAHGIVLGRATEHVEFVKASKEVAAHLDLDEGEPIMRLDRVVETADEIPIEWRIAYVPSR
jgi:DNA-binding GntR family transcriptional regulator